MLVGEEGMKGELNPGKNDFLLPQIHKLKFYLENIRRGACIL